MLSLSSGAGRNHRDLFWLPKATFDFSRGEGGLVSGFVLDSERASLGFSRI
jgi:hypothetical protein